MGGQGYSRDRVRYGWPGLRGGGELQSVNVGKGGVVRHRYHVALFTFVLCWILPASAAVTSVELIGEWCLVQQSMRGHGF